MTKSNPLVLDGSEVKLRLMAERTVHKTPVHVDWVRFTCLLRKVPFTESETLFNASDSIWDEQYRNGGFKKVLADIPDFDYLPATQALELATEICKALGKGFSVFPEVRKGHDFYRCRWSIERSGAECGWVGFLASGDSPRQSAQSSTIHANLYGHACTFADHGWNERIADLVDELEAKLTRADLALDFFDGLPGGMESLESQYHGGAMDVKGKRPKISQAGDWWNHAERSLYIGSKEAGKQTNVYEKGDQLFGRDSNSPWVRCELRYGNKLRVLPSDMLRRPADFFAGASDWHQLLLTQFETTVSAQKCPTEKPLATQTVNAEVTRNIRWAFNTAAPTIAAAFHFLGDEFLEFVTNQKLPGRLQKFNASELRSAFGSVIGSFSTAGSFSPSAA